MSMIFFRRTKKKSCKTHIYLGALRRTLMATDVMPVNPLAMMMVEISPMARSPAPTITVIHIPVTMRVVGPVADFNKHAGGAGVLWHKCARAKQDAHSQRQNLFHRCSFLDRDWTMKRPQLFILTRASPPFSTAALPTSRVPESDPASGRPLPLPEC